MFEDVPSVDAMHIKARSAVSNGKRAQLFGDGRSTAARRYRDLLSAFAGELGGIDGLAESERQIVRRAAQTSIECELLEAGRAAGEPVESTAYSTAANANRRALEALQRLKKTLKPKRTTLAEHLARNYPAKPQTEAVAA